MILKFACNKALNFTIKYNYSFKVHCIIINFLFEMVHSIIYCSCGFYGHNCLNIVYFNKHTHSKFLNWQKSASTLEFRIMHAFNDSNVMVQRTSFFFSKVDKYLMTIYEEEVKIVFWQRGAHIKIIYLNFKKIIILPKRILRLKQ